MKRLLLFWLLLALLTFAGGCDSTHSTTHLEGEAASDNGDEDNADDDDAGPAGGNDSADWPEKASSLAGPKQCEPVAPQAWPEPDLADPAVVAFDENLFFTVDGQRFFPLGYYNVPNDAAGLEQFKSEGFNLALTGPGCCGSGTQPQVDFLTLAQSKGLFVIMHPWSNANEVLTRPEEDLAAELAARNGVGSLFGWYTFDEPALWRPSKELTQRMHYILSTYSADHPDCLVEQAMDRFTLYVDDCAFFMVDPYPSPFIFLSMVKETVLEAREATQDLKPVVGVMQAFSWEWYDGYYDRPFHPSAWEERNMAWQFIVLGARGLIPWTYGAPYSMTSATEEWGAWLEHVAEINQLMRVILTDEAEIDLAVEATFPTMFDFVVKQEETATWILSVSTAERPIRVSFDLSSIGTDLCVVDYTTGEVFTQDDDGRVELSYETYQVRVIEVM